MILLWIIGFSVLGSVGVIIGVSLFLLCPDKLRQLLTHHILSYSIGILLGSAFLGLIPHALEQMAHTASYFRNGQNNILIMQTVLAGLVLFFLLEKVLIWRHCHNGDCMVHDKAGSLILIGDAFHNFVDGVVIAGAFLTHPTLGITTASAIIIHEIPQELGNFAILLNSKYSRKQAITFNLLSGMTTLPGAILGYFALESIRGTIPYILALSAASFIYIAMVDLVPGLHRQNKPFSGILQIILILLGISTIHFIHH